MDNLKKTTYSPNSKIEFIYNNGSQIQMQLSNGFLNKSITLYADKQDELDLIADWVFRTWAAEEIDYNYYPLGDVSTAKGSFWRFDVMGTDYRDSEAIAKAKTLPSGGMLMLLRERENEYDEKAIRVLTADGLDIGYVPARRCSEIGRKMGKVGVAWIEYNNLKYGECITALFSFDKCHLEKLKDEDVSKPHPRMRISKNNVLNGKLIDTAGRFLLFPDKHEVISIMRDFGAIPYWEHQSGSPELMVVGGSTPKSTLDILQHQKEKNPSLQFLQESELSQMVEQYQPGWMARYTKPSKPQKESQHDVGSARAYISKTLKKIENGSVDTLVYKQNLQDRVNLLLSANAPIGEDLKCRLIKVGVTF